MSAEAWFLADALDPARLAAGRERLEESGFEEFDLPWRGRYGENRTHEDSDLFRDLMALARETSGREISLTGFRWRRLRRGGYSLQYDDSVGPEAKTGAEIMLDLSEQGSEEAEAVWAPPLSLPWLVTPQRPGGVAIVFREPGTWRYERYLTHRMEGREVCRLYLAIEEGRPDD
jgi:hypothetical protein